MVTNRVADPDLPLGGGAPVVTLASILLDSFGELAKVGEVETACRLAGRACARLRHAEPQTARGFDVFLHRQTKRLQW